MSYKNTTIKYCLELQFIICGSQKVNCTKYNCCNLIKKYSQYSLSRDPPFHELWAKLSFFFTTRHFLLDSSCSNISSVDNIILGLEDTRIHPAPVRVLTWADVRGLGAECWIWSLVLGRPLYHRRKSAVARNNSRPLINLWYVSIATSVKILNIDNWCRSPLFYDLRITIWIKKSFKLLF